MKNKKIKVTIDLDGDILKQIDNIKSQLTYLNSPLYKKVLFKVKAQIKKIYAWIKNLFSRKAK